MQRIFCTRSVELYHKINNAMEIDHSSFWKWLDVIREGFDSFIDRGFIECLLRVRYHARYIEV